MYFDSAMTDFLAYSNITFFVAFLLWKFKSQFQAQAVVLIWTSLNTTFLYYLFWTLGASNPKVSLYGLKTPLYFVAIYSIIILLLLSNKWSYKSYRGLLSLVLIFGFTLFRHIPGIMPLIRGTENDLTLALYISTFVIPFQLCLLAPLTAFVSSEVNLFHKLFLFSLRHVKLHWRSLSIALLLFVLLVLIGNAVIYNEFSRIEFDTFGREMLMNLTLHLFFFVLVDHFVFIALTKRIVDDFFIDDESSLWEILLYAGLLAAFHYEYTNPEIVRWFLFGLVFGFMFIKTKTLSYSIILGAFYYCYVA